MNDGETRAKAAAIFLKAAAYIRYYGWQEKGMGVYGRPRCSMGALNSAYYRQKWEQELSAVMYEALNKELAGISLTQYNHKVRDGRKVARLFERTAASLK